MFAGNRGAIRQLTSNNTERCRIAKDTLVQHFSSVWQAPAVPLELKDFPPENPNLKFSPLRPPSWKIPRRYLHKDGRSTKNNGRPIALFKSIYKLFQSAGRVFPEWCEEHSILSPAQKGFTPYDGVIEHNFLINTHLDRARSAQGKLSGLARCLKVG
ncbi:hypothetical protein TNIN_490191 [Trichonephila inaurata madagascariensis]|uniref:Reverse transcriptase n=1 Tax=Trichonephila inaurata madagascariensis TaxID=2747483 RepID=A0A8X6MDQ1_9ARAC|nr:hypothetical protein TNIN_490191 [Trichonephila inaurata madagascariensis]